MICSYAPEIVRNLAESFLALGIEMGRNMQKEHEMATGFNFTSALLCQLNNTSLKNLQDELRRASECLRGKRQGEVPEKEPDNNADQQENVSD